MKASKLGSGSESVDDVDDWRLILLSILREPILFGELMLFGELALFDDTGDFMPVRVASILSSAEFLLTF